MQWRPNVRQSFVEPDGKIKHNSLIIIYYEEKVNSE